MDIRYSKNTERPVAEIVKEHFSLSINKPAGEYDRNLTDIVLYAGDEYKVKHNGSEYTCVAYEKDGAIHIGSESEPFDIYNFAGDIYVKAETDGANTFEVHHEKVKTFDYDVMPEGYPGVKQEVVTPMDYKFMPEGYPKVEMEEEQEVVTPMDYKFMPEGYPSVKTEMVEIVPEQSVTGEYFVDASIPIPPFYGYAFNNPNLSPLKEGGTIYIVSINGISYEAENKGDGLMIVKDDKLFFAYNRVPDDMFEGGQWDLSLGETITLAIYEKQEIVTQLDPKLVNDHRILLRYDEMLGDTNDVLKLWDALLYDYVDITADEFDEMTFEASKFPDVWLGIIKNGHSVRARALSITPRSSMGGVSFMKVYAIVNGEIVTFYVGNNPNSDGEQ